MPFYKVFSLFIAATIFLGTTSIEAEDRPLLRFLSEAKAALKSKSSSSSRTRKKTKKKTRRSFGGPKRVEINLTNQTLRAYQGNRVVIRTHISSGKTGHRTPRGNFRAGWKDADHRSSLYHDAPMPWSVQITGNFFIHGSGSVPNYPASHGCVRVPLTGNNAARRIYNWIDSGTPIRITY